MRHFTHLFVLIAFVLAGVSPACKFISGTKGASFIEICTLKGIELIPQKQQPDHKPQKTLEDCVFCFARDNTQTLEASSFEIGSPFLIALRDAPAIAPQAFYTAASFSFQARAPPV